CCFFFFSSRRLHTRSKRDWSSDVCSSDLEFASSKSNIKVKVDDVVKTGDVIGIRDTEHVHIGITKLPFDQAVSHSWDSSGGWIDPLETIKNGLKKGGSDDATGGLSSDEDSRSEERRVG